MSTVWIGARERVDHLQRLAVVFAVPIRLRIVMELFQREMSPSEFQKEFGGGSVSRIAKHFDRLTETGWLRRVHSRGPGGRRRGATETVYRAPELAFCDRETWIALPYSIRLSFSWNMFKEIAEMMRGATEAAALDARRDSRLIGMRLMLDEDGWTRVSEAVSQEFASQFEEQEDARRRVTHTGDDLFQASSLLMAFEMPFVADLRLGPVLIEGKDQMIPFPVRLSKVFEDEVCLQLIDEANRGEISVPMFHAKYGERFFLDEATIRRRLAKLVKYGWLWMASGKTGGRRRGATEKFYRATGPALYNEGATGPWANPSRALAETTDWQTFVRISDWVKRSMVAGTLIRRDETCLAWTVLTLDKQGWKRVSTSVEDLHAFILKEQELAEVRLKRSGEEPVEMAVGLGTFDSLKVLKEI